MKKVVIFALMVSLCALADNSFSNNTNAYEIIKKARNRYHGNDSKSLVKMLLINSRGKKRLKVYQLYRVEYNQYGNGAKSIFVIKKPADAKGVIFLQWVYGSNNKSDDRWLYLPALKRVRRISGTSTRNSFLGSDLSYEDLAMGSRSVDLDSFKLLKEENFQGRKCWVIEATPKDKSYIYSKYVTWITQNELIGIKTILYDDNGKLLKTMIASDIQKIQNIWTALKMEIKNVQEDHTTIVETSPQDMKYNIGLGMHLFTVSSVERGWVK